MMGDKDNTERANKAFSEWPSWKKDFSITKYSAISTTRSDARLESENKQDESSHTNQDQKK